MIDTFLHWISNEDQVAQQKALVHQLHMLILAKGALLNMGGSNALSACCSSLPGMLVEG